MAENAKSYSDSAPQTDSPSSAPPPVLEPAHQESTAMGGVGAGVAGALAGAVAGSLIGPAGTVIGGAIGAVAGAVVGAVGAKVVGDILNPEEEGDFWENEFADRPYFIPGMTWADYLPAYRLGWEGRRRQQAQSFDEAEPWLHDQWDRNPSGSRLRWEEARPAARDGWDRISNRIAQPQA